MRVANALVISADSAMQRSSKRARERLRTERNLQYAMIQRCEQRKTSVAEHKCGASMQL